MPVRRDMRAKSPFALLLILRRLTPQESADFSRTSGLAHPTLVRERSSHHLRITIPMSEAMGILPLILLLLLLLLLTFRVPHP
jgi:hypothetical protein